MKNMFPAQKLILFTILSIAIAACKKEKTITVQQPTACFMPQVTDLYGTFQFNGTAANIDSTFYFRNCSDSGSNIRYSWSFGDGSMSTEKNPRHSYSKRGKYAVTLVVSNDDLAYDTAQQIITVMLGQQHISFGDGVNASPVGIEETANHEFVLLGSTGYGLNFFLIQLDSLLKQKSMKTFPASYRLASMQSTTDGNYIFTGTTTGLNRANELIKMQADGTLLWSKTSATDDNYSYAAPTPDGGYGVVASKPVPGPYGNAIYYTLIKKTDNNGSLQWQKLLEQEGMINTRDAVFEQDGIVVAGVKRNVSNTCQDCDSLLIVKLNNSGNVIWQNTVLWGFNTSNWWNTRIIKLINGNYAVTNEYTRGIFYFSPSGVFLDRKLTPYQISSLINSGDGKIVALQGDFNVGKFSYEGVQEWSARPDGRQKTPGGYSCCSSNWPVAIRPLRNGGTLATGYRVDNNATGYDKHNVIVLLELDETGKFK